MNVCIGDFGVATIMGDVRTKTRTAVGTSFCCISNVYVSMLPFERFHLTCIIFNEGSMNWMAPEVLERPYDERSDVWSLGCIALELITCGIYDSIAMAGKLCEIKHNQQALEDILTETLQVQYVFKEGFLVTCTYLKE